jgi:hypothetical protein
VRQDHVGLERLGMCDRDDADRRVEHRGGEIVQARHLGTEPLPAEPARGGTEHARHRLRRCEHGGQRVDERVDVPLVDVPERGQLHHPLLRSCPDHVRYRLAPHLPEHLDDLGRRPERHR